MSIYPNNPAIVDLQRADQKGRAANLHIGIYMYCSTVWEDDHMMESIEG